MFEYLINILKKKNNLNFFFLIDLDTSYNFFPLKCKNFHKLSLLLLQIAIKFQLRCVKKCLNILEKKKKNNQNRKIHSFCETFHLPLPRFYFEIDRELLTRRKLASVVAWNDADNLPKLKQSNCLFINRHGSIFGFILKLFAKLFTFRFRKTSLLPPPPSFCVFSKLSTDPFEIVTGRVWFPLFDLIKRDARLGSSQFSF